MSRRTTRLALDRRSLLGGALLGGVGAVIGGRTAEAAPSRSGTGIAAPPTYATGPLVLRMLLAPIRVYDSRAGQPPEGTDPLTGANDTRMVRNTSRRIDVSFVLGNEALFTGVPTTSDAVLLNVTAVGASGPSGFLKLWADDVAEPATSSLNWDHAGAIIANSVTTRHDGGFVKIGCGGPLGASTNVIIDVLGYYETVSLTPI